MDDRPDRASDRSFESLWKEVVDRWEDEAVHGRFLDACSRTQRLAEAAVRYSRMRGDREKGKEAEKRLQAIAMLAQMALLATKTERKTGTPRWLRLLAAAIFGGFLVYAVIRLAGM